MIFIHNPLTLSFSSKMSTLTVSAIQSQLHWEDKSANLKMFEEKIFAIPGKPEIVVLPEMFSTGFSMRPEILAEEMDGPTLSWMKKLARSRSIILTGSLIIREEGKYFNRLIWMLPDGTQGYYDKRHLFAYGGENLKYSPGSRRLIASVKGWKINLQICYDLRFPVWSRQATLNDKRGTGEKRATDSPGTDPNTREMEYDLLIYVANWPERRSPAWKILLQSRAIENQCFVVGLNRVGLDGHQIYHSGDSMVIDPLGDILDHRSREEAILTCTLEKDRIEEIRLKFPFWKDADDFMIES
jgi:omega-amidase